MAYPLRYLLARSIDTNNPNLIFDMNPKVIKDEINLDAYGFFKKHLETYKVLPTKEFFENENPDLEGWLDVTSSLTDSELLNKVFEYEKNNYTEHLASIISNSSYSKKEKDEAYKTLSVVQQQTLGSKSYISAADVNSDVLITDYRYYDTGIVFLDEIVGGFESGTFNTIVAPTGVGKTSFSTLLATLALQTGNSVLYVPTETGKNKTKIRVAQYAQKQNYANIRRNEKEKEKFVATMKTMPEFKNLFFTERDFPTVDQIVRAYNIIKPDIVIIEGLYDLPSDKSSDDIGKQIHVVNELREFVTEKNAILFATTQTNRKSIENGAVSLSDVGGTVKIQQHSDTLFSISKNGTLDNILKIDALKVRIRASNRKNFCLHIDYNKMDVIEMEDLGGAVSYKVI